MIQSSQKVVCTQAKLAHTAGAYPGFFSITNIATLTGWDASPLQVTPSILLPGYYALTVHWYKRILLQERHCEIKVSCPRTQHDNNF